MKGIYMGVKEAIVKFVESNECYTLYHGYPIQGENDTKCLGVIIPKDYSYMEFLARLTEYLDENGVDDVDLELDGMGVDSQGQDTVIYFPELGD
jgi:hypothetical protein